MNCDTRNCPNTATQGVTLFALTHTGRILTHKCDWCAKRLKSERRKQGVVFVPMGPPFDAYEEEQ